MRIRPVIYKLTDSWNILRRLCRVNYIFDTLKLLFDKVNIQPVRFYASSWHGIILWMAQSCYRRAELSNTTVWYCHAITNHMTNMQEMLLSPEAFTELKRIVIAEYGREISDEEINEMGIGLLKLFSRLDVDDSVLTNPLRRKPTAYEFNALKYVHNCLHHDKKSPTVRGIANAIGLRSSRSGLRMMNVLLKQGFIYRDEQGTVGMRE